MYTFSSKLKTFSIALIILGALGIGYGFFTAPKTTEEIKEMLHSAEDDHSAASTHEIPEATHETGEELAVDESHKIEEGHQDADQNELLHTDLAQEADSIAQLDGAQHDQDEEHSTENIEQLDESHADAGGHDAHDNEEAHYEHELTFAQNRPWAAVYIPLIFFLLVSVCAFVYYCIQRASSAGWSPVLFRVMEGISAYILPGSILLIAFLVYTSMHGNHLFAWMYTSTDPTAENFDFAMETKGWWLNVPFFLARAVFYVLIWIGFRHFIIKNSRAQDKAGGDLKNFKRNFTLSVVFLVVFLVSELFMAFDWLMSIDHHWFSQLYSFYVFASMFVSGITVIAFVTIYLRSRGYLPHVNDSHIHDLAKYMFAFSIFWTYLWFAQFMLQWYANIPEEAVYFTPRLLGTYQPLFIGMLIMNFVFPILILMNSDYKRVPWFVILAGLVILTGHYLDIFILVSPGTVGSHWHFGIPEIGGLMFFLGLFIYVVFNALTKAPLHAEGDPFMKESEIYHY